MLITQGNLRLCLDNICSLQNVAFKWAWGRIMTWRKNNQAHHQSMFYTTLPLAVKQGTYKKLIWNFDNWFERYQSNKKIKKRQLSQLKPKLTSTDIWGLKAILTSYASSNTKLNTTIVMLLITHTANTCRKSVKNY